MSTPVLVLVLVVLGIVGGSVAAFLGLRHAWRELDGETHRQVVRAHEDHIER